MIALDVGYGQLHERLRADPRVVVLERTNARELRSCRSRRSSSSATSRSSASGRRCRRCSRSPRRRWEAVVLVKPQFEAARGEAPKGVVRDVAVRRRVVREVAEAALAWGGETAGVVDSGLPGPKGNREVFLHLVQREQPQLPDDIDDRIAAEIS